MEGWRLHKAQQAVQARSEFLIVVGLLKDGAAIDLQLDEMSGVTSAMPRTVLVMARSAIGFFWSSTHSVQSPRL